MLLGWKDANGVCQLPPQTALSAPFNSDWAAHPAIAQRAISAVLAIGVIAKGARTFDPSKTARSVYRGTNPSARYSFPGPSSMAR